MNPELETAARLAVAGLIGLAVGIEREWSGHASGPGARFAGVRTFLLIGLLGGVSGFLAAQGWVPLAVVLLLGGAALAVTAYASVARRDVPEAVDGTTEAAALLVLALGAAAALGHVRLAAGMAAVMVLALREKSAIQGFVRRIGEVELRAVFQFAVLALVLLPILPEGPFGPLGGIRPRSLWVVVLLVSGLNVAGYLAGRFVGERRGSVVAGLLGGLVSSTAVALSFSRASRERDASGPSLAAGVVAACTVLVPRLIVLSLILQPSLAWPVARVLGPSFLVGVALLVYHLRARHGARDDAAPPATSNPLRLGSALLMAVGFQLTLMLMVLASERLGERGVLATSAVLGLTDMDALTVSLTRLASEPSMVPVAARAMGIGVLANTVLKLGLCLGLGKGAYRVHTAIGLGALGVATLAGLLFIR